MSRQGNPASRLAWRMFFLACSAGIVRPKREAQKPPQAASPPCVLSNSSTETVCSASCCTGISSHTAAAFRASAWPGVSDHSGAALCHVRLHCHQRFLRAGTGLMLPANHGRRRFLIGLDRRLAPALQRAIDLVRARICKMQQPSHGRLRQAQQRLAAFFELAVDGGERVLVIRKHSELALERALLC